MKRIGRHVFGNSMGILMGLLGLVFVVTASHQTVQICSSASCKKSSILDVAQFPESLANFRSTTHHHDSKKISLQASASNVSKTCGQHLDYLMNHYSNFETQSNIIIDDILIRLQHLKSVWPDPFDQCLRLRAHASSSSGNSKIQGQYCIAYFLPSSIDKMREEEVQLLKGVRPVSRYPHPIPETGLCLPSSCTAEDTQEYLKFLLQEAASNYTIFVPPKYCQTEQEGPLPLITQIVLAAIFLIIFMALLGTFVEVFTLMKKSKRRTKQENGKTVSQATKTQESFGHSVIKCFSLYSNMGYLFNLNPVVPGEIECFNGGRFISSIGCQIIHVIILGNHNYWSNSDVSISPFLHNMTTRGFFYIQLLLQSSVMMSGTVICMSTLQRIQVRDKGGFSLTSFYLRRLWRLSVPYYTTLALIVGVVPYLGSGPKWPDVQHTVDVCKNYWWANVLYINNYVTDPMCQFHTWYLSSDVQLLLIAPVVILAFNRSGRIGFTIAGVLMFYSVSRMFYMAYFNSMNAWYIGTYPSVSGVLNYFGTLYFLTYSRIGCYSLGITFGYLTYTYGKDVLYMKSHHPWMVLLGGTFSFSPFWLWYRYHHNDSLPATELEASLCEAFSRILFSSAAVYIASALETGCRDFITSGFRLVFSGKYYVFTAKLSYAVFLLHVIVLEIFLATRPQPMEFSCPQLLKVVFGTLALTHILAIPFTLLVVFPSARLEKVIEERLTRKHTVKKIKLPKQKRSCWYH